MCFAGLAIAVIYLWGAETKGRRTGLIAALLFALVPTTFYHAHLDCFDVPITAMWLLTAWCYHRSLTARGWGWALVTGVVFGLTLDTKHNSWFLPFAVVAHTLLSRGTGLLRDLTAGRLRLPLSLISMATVGPLVFVALWPWLWFETAARFAWYVQFHTGHEYYNMEFLGETWWRPPFPRGYAWVMSAATIPMVTLSLFVIGVIRACHERIWPTLRGETPSISPGSVELLWGLGVLINYAPWLSPGTPIFGGTKHWMTAYPFLMLLAGHGFDWLAAALGEAASQPWLRRAAPWLLGGASLAAPAAETFHAHPWGLSAYTPLVGGTPGAASLGLNRGFWGYSTGSVVDILNDRVPQGGSVYIHDTAWESWRMLQRDGRLRADIRGVGSPAVADAALYHHEQHMEGVEYQIWVALGTTTPAAVAGLDQVPIVLVYVRPPGR
jgi:4-amino-4-deoxy-L-arabinose transferase-like glycosyltransferase